MASEEEIRDLAYKLWEDDGCPDGQDQEHYFAAVHMLSALDREAEVSPNFTNVAMTQNAAVESSVAQEISVGVS